MSSLEIKARIHQLVDESDDPTLLAIEEMLKKHQEEQFWDDEEIASLNRDIAESERQILNGEFIAHEEMKKRMQSW